MKRRSFLGGMGALATLGVPVVSHAADKPVGQVVVIGAGFGGATAAKYLRLFSKGRVGVTLIDPNEAFISCPISNLVLEGRFDIDEVTRPYLLEKNHGVQQIRDMVDSVDPVGKTVTLRGGQTLSWDRLIVAPGIDFMWEQMPGLNNAQAQEKILHAWKAGPQTVALRKQLEAMPDGGRFILTIPEAPYRCPPGPYERACMVASYLKKHKPGAKIHIFDANPDVTSKGALFKAAWKDLYADVLEYVPAFKAVDVVADEKRVIFELGEEEVADVLNVIPPMRAGDIAVESGLATANGRWCEVDFLTFESTVAPGVHVLGDAIQIAPGMPKSGHMANQHGKNCAAAVAALLLERPVNGDPVYANTCFSFVDASQAMHVASVHRYNFEKKTMLTVEGSGGLSAAPSNREGRTALSWLNAITADALT